jgi:hypothetical protein
MLLFSACCIVACRADDCDKFNPSGVWQLHEVGNQSFIESFSWGDNATYSQATAIDLGASAPFVQTGWGRFYISSTIVEGNRIQFKGKWSDGEVGAVILRVVDKDTIWFEMTIPEQRELTGKDSIFKRVPANAPIVPIDPEKGP